MTLLESTVNLLNRHKATGKSLAAIHKELGDAVNRNWFYKFAAGDIDDPSINKIQALHDSLQKISLPN
jgi:hypothetical protein